MRKLLKTRNSLFQFLIDRKAKNWMSVICICFLQFSCTHNTFTPAIVLTFDDDHVESWYENRELFNKYNAKVTFFITRPHKLNSKQIELLHQLQSDGHEIACHTLNHLDAINYIDSSGIQEYLIQEVDSCKSLLNAQGFKINSFAYPYGSTNQELIDSLKTRFVFQRGATYNKTNLFYRQKRTFDKWNSIYLHTKNQYYSEAMGIDKIFGNSMSHIKPGIDRCKTDSNIMLLYAHKIVEKTPKNYQIDVNTLDSILSYANSIGVKFLRCQDLVENQ